MTALRKPVTGMPDARAVTAALHGKWLGSFGLVRCPCHEDHTPSLSVKDGEKGLICYCFAGCSWQAIKAELRRRGLIGEFTRPPAFGLQENYRARLLRLMTERAPLSRGISGAHRRQSKARWQRSILSGVA